ncbi:MAG TPA: DNA ligase D [Elusimicrobiota bacterium]|nr:DNA ligase D [Elusimicrobiota bacterium]
MSAARSLGRYRAKRDFRRTPEPRGRAAARRQALSFVVQRHAARRLHYDLRLELDGVLKSWAVPKEPSLDPGRKRLAVHVEDHPLEYGGFEGEIPRGQYGAGTVRIWDRGRWMPEGDPHAGLRKGHLAFRLEGLRLRGSWRLVALRDDPARKNWLLIKVDDGARARPASSAQAPAPQARRGELPERVQPQLARLAERAPEGDRWLHEIKFDGYRILAFLRDGKARLVTRNGNDWTARFDDVAEAVRGLPADALLLDGEVVALDDEGRSDFQLLQNALRDGRRSALVYYAFDLLHLDGWDLRGAPLSERKRALAGLLQGADPVVRYVDHVEGGGGEMFRGACALALEGVVSKLKDAPYRPGRGPDWIKAKCLKEQEFVVGGFTEPSGSRSAFGALLLGAPGARGLEYAGKVGTGFTEASLRELRGKFRRLETRRPPFSHPPRDRGTHWLRPELVAQVAFEGWTRDGRLRQPSFHGLREDKRAAEVRIERPVPAAPRGLTHPDRVLYPGQGLTKADLAAYYEAAADSILPHIGGRPVALVRCPGGAGKPCFFQKHAGEEFPAAVKAAPIRERDGRVELCIYVDDLAGLLGLVQLGALELHPWGSRVGDVERPDRLVFDLDPSPGLPFGRVLSAAREVRDRLEAVGLRSFVKTTGGKGLHVVAPIQPREEWPAVKSFAKALAASMASDSPRAYTARLPKAERAGKIFVDYLRNDRGATAVCAYSTRARDGAPVSTPLAWEELTPSLRPERFDVRTLPRRLSARPDPWPDFFRLRQPLPSP